MALEWRQSPGEFGLFQVEKLRVYERNLSDPGGAGGGKGRPPRRSGAEGCVPGIAALTKALPGEERQAKADVVLWVAAWLPQEAGAKTGLEVEAFLRGDGGGTEWEGSGESQALCTSALGEGAGEAISLPPSSLRKIARECCTQSPPPPPRPRVPSSPWNPHAPASRSLPVTGWEQPGGKCGLGNKPLGEFQGPWSVKLPDGEMVGQLQGRCFAAAPG